MNAINKSANHKAKSINIPQFLENNEETQKLCSESDIIIFERNFFQDQLTMLMFWWVRGKTIAGIWDDAYDRMHVKNVSYNFWQHGEMKLEDKEKNIHTVYMHPKPLIQFKHGLHILKGVQTVSQALCDDWKPYVDTYLIHNHLVLENYNNIKPLYPHDKNEIWIGWTGSLSHLDSFESSGLLRAYRKICKKFPQVKVLVSGDKRIFDTLDIPNHKKMFSGFVPPEQYPSLIKSLDVYTIPLYGEYDIRRSQIKPLECLALEVPFVASNFPNYNHLAPYGNFTENGWQNWENSISEVIENLPKYQEKAKEVGRPFAETQNIDLHVDERVELYQKLIDKPYRYEET